MSKKINSSCARIRGGYAFDGYNGAISDTQSSLGVNCGISTGRNGVMLILESNQNHARVTDDGISPTLPAAMGMGGGYIPMITEIYAINSQGGADAIPTEGVTETITAATNSSGNNRLAVAYGICSYESNAFKSANPDSAIYKASTARTLDNNGGNPACNQGGIAIVDSNRKEGDVMNDVQYRVRRLTPLECERLQGFPDNWTNIGEEIETEVKDYEYQTETRELPDGGYEDVERKVCVGTHKEIAKYWRDSKDKLHKLSDAPRFRALGNSVALPYWRWMMQNMAKYLPENATLGSLFDGISGFPKIWEEIHGKGTARWSSEVEEFCIAVAKYHFGED